MIVARRFRLVLLLTLLSVTQRYGQAQVAPDSRDKAYTISGFVTDSASGERLIGANIYAINRTVGTASNSYGFYSITLPADSVYLRTSYIGFQSQYFALRLGDDTKLDIAMVPEALSFREVEVVGRKHNEAVESTRMSTMSLPVARIKQIPALLGESDVIKALQLLPGVQSGSEGSSGLYVRGGGPDQNLILLDGAPVYNANHVFGFFSVFNPDALQHVQLTKGAFPARYGGRLSSVLDIHMKEGNLKRFEADGAVGVIFSKLTVQGPIRKDKMSFLVSGRRTYIDVLTRPFIRRNTDSNPVFYFGDLNAKLNYVVTPQSRLYVSFYTGRDAFGNGYTEDLGQGGAERFDGGLDWSNRTGTLRWNYVLSDKLFANTTLMYSRYLFDVSMEIEETFRSPPSTTRSSIHYASGIEDFSGKVDFDYLPTPNHAIRFGGLVVHHTFNPGVGRFDETEGGLKQTFKFTPDSSKFSGLEFYTYAEDDWRFGPRLKANLGVHASGMRVKDTFYGSIQPRLAARFLIRDNWSTKVSFGTMQQYLHLLTNAGIGLPTDLWVAATDRIPPQKAWQAAFGVTHTRDAGLWELSAEGYYKDMRNLIEYVPGATFVSFNDDWQDKVTIGNGWSYGAELFVQKTRGKTTGWLGYTLSWTERKFADLNEGNAFPARYDRRHDISMVVSHRLGEKWDLGGTWVYGTGNAVTLATARVGDFSTLAGYWSQPLQHYGPRNDFRMGAYHRMDLSLRWFRKWSTWTLSVYNVYNRRNPFFYYGGYENGRDVYKQVSLFPIIPSLTWSFKF